MLYKDLIARLQKELNRHGENLKVDGDFGPKTSRALTKYDVNVTAAPRVNTLFPEKGFTHVHPIDWARGELGQKEIKGLKDNPRIRFYHTFSGNIGRKEHPDEVPWCSSFLNAAADLCGMEKTDNALARSWLTYGFDAGEVIEEGDVVVLGTSHVTLANKGFNLKTDLFFEGLGGNQSDMVKVSTFKVSNISACRKWVPLFGTVTAPIGTKSTDSTGNGDKESTR
jgi:uncharacterized protein (TIGR02594 family)